MSLGNGSLLFVRVCYEVACLALFLIPSCYAAQAAATVFLHAEARDRAHNPTTATVDRLENLGPQQLQSEPESSIPSPPKVHLQTRSTLSRSWNDARRHAFLSIQHNLDPNTLFLTSIQNKWVTYVDHCCYGWKVFVRITTTCLLALPPFLQIAGPKDAIVRGLMYISIIHFATSLASAWMLVYYFCKDNFRTGKFAMDWYNSAKQYRKSYSQMPWIVLSVPAIFFCWAIAFVIVALATSVWRGGIFLSDPSPIKQDVPFVTVARSIVSVLFFADVACVAVLFCKLRALAE